MTETIKFIIEDPFKNFTGFFDCVEYSNATILKYFFYSKPIYVEIELKNPKISEKSLILIKKRWKSFGFKLYSELNEIVYSIDDMVDKLLKCNEKGILAYHKFVGYCFSLIQ